MVLPVTKPFAGLTVIDTGNGPPPASATGKVAAVVQRVKLFGRLSHGKADACGVGAAGDGAGTGARNGDRLST